MRIILKRKRNQGLIFLGVIVLVIALGLGGCAVFEMTKRIKKLEKEREVLANKVELLEEDKAIAAEMVFDPVEPVEPPVQNNGNAITTHGATKIDTNWYNPALEDETGF